MILKASQRSGHSQLARHLTKPENEHVELHEIRGFIADTVAGALKEAYAISRGTRCRQFMFSLSLNPPENECVPVAAFEHAIERIERKLGLSGQPRVVIFHEKEGRRHSHCVWSRIDAESMKAINLPHFKMKLMDISRELYIEHGWKMPDGMVDIRLRNPLNFDRHEWFQAKRTGQDPRDIKALFRQCWASSDSGKAFRQALEQRGYFLAHGDRRAVVALDIHGEVYAVARWVGVKSKDVIARIDNPDALPSVSAVQAYIAEVVKTKLSRFIGSAADDFAKASQGMEAKRLAMVQRHRTARIELQSTQGARWTKEAVERAERFRRGFLGLWDRVTGKHAKLRKHNEEEAVAAAVRDAAEKQALIDRQLDERHRLKREIHNIRRIHARDVARLHRELSSSAKRMEQGPNPEISDYPHRDLKLAL